MIENMFDESYDVLLGFAQKLSDVPNIGICLDYAHAAAFGKYPEEWLAQLAPFVKHMHLNDNDLKEDMHLPVGEGAIDWKRFDDTYHAAGAEATALIEVKGAKKQRASLEYMKQNGIYIRKS